MKVLPMHQPWATLVVMGAKKVETRPQPAPASMKGRVAVHANKTNEALYVLQQDPFDQLLKNVQLPFGFIVGTVEIVRSVTLTDENVQWQLKHNPTEFALGNYGRNPDGSYRFGWVLANPVQFEEPIPFRAHQGWPDVDDAIIRAAK